MAGIPSGPTYIWSDRKFVSFHLKKKTWATKGFLTAGAATAIAVGSLLIVEGSRLRKGTGRVVYKTKGGHSMCIWAIYLTT